MFHGIGLCVKHRPHICKGARNIFPQQYRYCDEMFRELLRDIFDAVFLSITCETLFK